ncbi:MAG: sulfurtransferase TusA family protein [Gammaproteobacteria bacterium]|nr:sulfurtransferase TusA family protein [Gammaproteobacteria bacterium]MCW8973532.1 sulfurtransferase TusA family protein [Gammaproteobacteria bacterium]MCW8992658.1 sulfurtransferase TusA family protein [Gammaproteobacteria bacterium]MCW9089074.1 sulfurtransferase TusA family protein [Gammaproteobacteria bacterium]
MAIKFDKIGDGEYELDVKGYTCPHPQMYTKKALQKLSGGDVLNLIFDNPSSGESIMAMVEGEGNEIIEKQDGDGSFIWKIRKG